MKKIFEWFKERKAVAGLVLGGLAAVAYYIYRKASGNSGGSVQAAGMSYAMSPGSDGTGGVPASSGGSTGGDSTESNGIMDGLTSFATAMRDALKGQSELLSSAITQQNDSIKNVMDSISGLTKQIKTASAVHPDVPAPYDEPSQPPPVYTIPQSQNDGGTGGSAIVTIEKSAKTQAQDVISSVRTTGKAVTGLSKEVQNEVSKQAQSKQKTEHPEQSFDHFKGTPGL